MKIPWIDNRCILCPKEGSLTKEHIIPDHIGGTLWSKILCNECNSYLGHTVEACIEEYDWLLSIDGKSISSPEDLIYYFF